MRAVALTNLMFIKPMQRSFVRTMVVVSRGPKKDPKSFMVSPRGVEYPPSPSVMAPVREFLGAEYALPESLVLQAVTHKSFAHAKAPYNEKLAIIGNQLLRLEASRAVVDESGCDVHSNALELPASSLTTSQICKMANMNDALFWKAANDSDRSEATVASRAVNALIGAVMTEHGLEKAQQFVRERLMVGKYSVFELAAKLFVNKN